MRLRRSDPARPGYRRVRRGGGFGYRDGNGRALAPDEVARIRALSIPPAWREVWICPDARGHLQAVGVDAAGRRQYRYHDVWRAQRDAAKFDHVLEVAERLPRLRRRVVRDLGRRGFDRDRVLAAAGLAAAEARFRTARDRAVRRVVREVADFLGNTPAVARASYVDPRVVDLYHDGVTVSAALRDVSGGLVLGDPASHRALERDVLRMLREETPHSGG